RSLRRWRLDAGLLAAMAALCSLFPSLLAVRSRSTLPAVEASAPAPSCSPEARAFYEEGMQEFTAARNTSASQLFARATEVDPSCGEAQLRLVLSTEPTTSRVLPRERLRRAIALRDALGEHDRIVLDAWTTIVAPDAPRNDEAVRILEEGLRRHPD